MRHKKLFFLIVILTFNLSFSSVKDLTNAFKNELGIEIILDTTLVSTWPLVHYKKPTDYFRLETYLKILKFEFEKYPKEYFKKIDLQKIVICNDLKVKDVKRAAVPDPEKHALFFAINSNYTRSYLVHVMHHELHHFTEHTLWKTMYYKWNRWHRKNIRKFEYSAGGQIAYFDENKKVDWNTLNNPVKGFLNLYSTTGQEEDRCEIVALMMHDSKRHLLIDLCQKDRKLKRKTKLIMRTLDKLSNTKKNYWRYKITI